MEFVNFFLAGCAGKADFIVVVYRARAHFISNVAYWSWVVYENRFAVLCLYTDVFLCKERLLNSRNIIGFELLTGGGYEEFCEPTV
jgi:hypothetical protein